MPTREVPLRHLGAQEVPLRHFIIRQALCRSSRFHQGRLRRAPLRHFASSGVTLRCFTCPGTSAKTYRWVPLRYFARPSLAGSLSARSEGRSFRHLLCSGTSESGWRSRDQAVLALDLGASDADSRPLPHNDSFANKYPYARQRTKTGKKLGMPVGLKFSFELHPNGAIDIA